MRAPEATGDREVRKEREKPGDNVSKPQTTGEPRARRSHAAQCHRELATPQAPANAITHPDRGPRTSSVRSGPAEARTAYATTTPDTA